MFRDYTEIVRKKKPTANSKSTGKLHHVDEGRASARLGEEGADAELSKECHPGPGWALMNVTWRRTSWLPVAAAISRTAASPFSWLRHRRHTDAPLQGNGEHEGSAS
jgi:hypothetical protein